MHEPLTRRDFLHYAATGAGGALLLPSLGFAAQPSVDRAAGTAAAASRPTTTAASQPTSMPWWQGERSQVVEVRSPRAVDSTTIHERRLREMIDLALRMVTDTPTIADAWQRLLKPDDVVGLKFNRSGAEGLGTTEPFVRLLVESLTQAGWAPEKIVLIEIDHHIVRRLKTQPLASGWQGRRVRFGSGEDQFAAVLDQVTALINVPFLKANRMAGMSGCLKNLSHAMIRRPALFHANASPKPKKGVLKPGSWCSPYIGDIVAAPVLADKLRLHLVNAMRTCCEPMSEPRGRAIEMYGAVLAGRDPVAIDMVGLEMLNQQRLARKLPPLAKRDAPLPQHVAASDAGVGRWHPDLINHLTARA